MLTPEQRNAFLAKAYEAAVKAGHVFPGAAAAECALESAWGTSELATKANNLFGLKKPEAWTGLTLTIPTQEFLADAWVRVDAVWPIFPDWAGCFAERMAVLKAAGYYADALAATTPEEFIMLVSQHWSTDPERAAKVLATYRAHAAVLGG